MVAGHLSTRMDTVELRYLICRKIGDQRAEMYFDQLRRLFGLQLSKVEFDKLCVRTIGRENLSLHNRLIKSLIKNACLAKVPPPKVGTVEGSLGVKVANGYQRSCLQSLNSEAFPQSPRKSRSSVTRDRRYGDRQSPLGLLGKSPSITGEEVVQRVQEQQSATELHSLGSRPPVEAASVEDGEEVEQFAGSPSIQSRSPVTAPLGISMNMGGARKAIRGGFGYSCAIYPESCQNSGVLPDTRSLKNRLEKKLKLEGVGISMDCTNLLNDGLDVFLKRLIEPCIAIAGARSGIEHVRHINGQSIPGYINGRILPDYNGVLQGRIAKKAPRAVYANVLDFRVAVESNPRILGEDWSIQLEKIYARAMEE